MSKLTFAPTLRVLLVLVAAAPLAAFTDNAKKFSIDFPADWSAPVTDDRGNVQVNAPTASDPIWCRANSTSLQSLKGSTQANLNKQYAAPLDVATWAGVLSVDASKVKLIAHEARVVNGAVVQFATLSFAREVTGIEATGRFTSHILPGRMVNAACFASTQAYPDKKAVFEKILTSLKPL